MGQDQSKALTREDARYERIFSVENETEGRGHRTVDDPYPAFAALRENGPVLPVSIFKAVTGRENDQFIRTAPHFSTLSFESCNKALLNNETYSSLVYHELPSVMESIGHTILTMVGSEHARYRSSIQPMMTRQNAMGWWTREWIEPFVDTLVDDLVGKPQADLSLQLCARLPMHTVTAAYGLTSEDALAFRENLLASLNSRAGEAACARAKTEVRAVLLKTIMERRSERRDDLISRLIDSPFKDADGKKSYLDNEAIISFSRLLLLAGGGTTFRQLGIALFALLSHRDQWEDLRADRSLIPRAFEESLRWNCTDPVFYRLATCDSELGGLEIPGGAIIDVCLASGNRDPDRWHRPDVFDIHRPIQRHIGFAAGPHTCLGRFVAEAEMVTMTNALLDRLPRMRLDEFNQMPRITGGLQARGVDSLRVRMD